MLSEQKNAIWKFTYSLAQASCDYWKNKVNFVGFFSCISICMSNEKPVVMLLVK